MPEGNANIEIAAQLREADSGAAATLDSKSKLRLELLEIAEAVVLALVALSTALSGYQAAKWDGVSAKDYASSSEFRVLSEQALLSSNQYLAYNAGNVAAWLQAKSSGNVRLAAILSNRFTSDYKPAFDAWARTHPLTNPDAPAGPIEMPQFRDPAAAKAAGLSEKATASYEAGIEARENGEKYVRLTVILAAVLFLIAVGQRFRIRNVRWTVLGVAGAFTVYALVLLLISPKA